MQFMKSPLSGTTKPLSLVDRMFVQQGFTRKQSLGEPVYNMKMEDTATSSVYFLRIPVKTDQAAAGKQGEPLVRIGHPYLNQKQGTRNVSRSRNGGHDIPLSITRAAEHKLAEIADYLKVIDRQAVRDHFSASAERATQTRR